MLLRIPPLPAFAAVLLVLSFGLPWGTVGADSEFVPGFVTPSFCTPEWSSGTIYCSPMYVSPGYIVGGAGAASPGSSSPARVALAAALLLTVYAARRIGAHHLLAVAAVALIVAAGLYGTALRTGVMVAIGAAALLLWEWSRRRRAALEGLNPTGRHGPSPSSAAPA